MKNLLVYDLNRNSIFTSIMVCVTIIISLYLYFLLSALFPIVCLSYFSIFPIPIYFLSKRANDLAYAEMNLSHREEYILIKFNN